MDTGPKIYEVTRQIGKTVLFYAFSKKWEKVAKILIELPKPFKEQGEEITPEKLTENLKLYFEKTVAQAAVMEILPSLTEKWNVLEVRGN